MPDPKPPDEETMVKVAVADLGPRFPGVARSRIESVVRRIVQRWSGRARIKTYIGIISWRQAREELEDEVGASSPTPIDQE